MIILNLGCGSKTSALCVNVDWSIYLLLARNRIFKNILGVFLTEQRRRKLYSLSDNVVVADLRKRLPFADESAHAVYHSHFLEHIDRDSVPNFLMEVHRVLRRGGIHRICVPDLEKLVHRYLDHIQECDHNAQNIVNHDRYISDILEQMVRKEAFGTSMQTPLRRAVEGILLGDARQRGETHQWMYDRHNLSCLLQNCGFSSVRVCSFMTSSIPGWQEMNLEIDESGHEYKPGSLYIECVA